MALLPDVDELRREFPLTNKWAYLNHAAWGPFPTRTVTALEEYARGWASPPDFDGNFSEQVIQDVRDSIAELAGGDPSMVAFTSSLAEGMNLLLNGIDWKPGENVVMPVNEFPSVVYPALNLEHRGVSVKMVEKDADGRTDYGKLEAAIDGKTRAVAISHVEFADGFKNDLKALGDICKSKGVELFVDATQSLGAQPIDIDNTGVTAISAHCYKWLMASFGIAPVVFSKGSHERIRPTYAGRNSVVGDWSDPDFKLEYRPDAGRFQTGGMNIMGLTALRASLTLVRKVGPAQSSAHTNALIDRLAAGVGESGYSVVSSLDPIYRSQIVTISTGDLERDNQVVAELEARDVSVTMRPKGIRVSPYFYNTNEDIDRLLEALPPQ
jgi:cysteine desulfurase / selenocysteine lyase